MDMSVKDWKNRRWKGINGRKLWRMPRPKLSCRAGGEDILMYYNTSYCMRIFVWLCLAQLIAVQVQNMCCNKRVD